MQPIRWQKLLVKATFWLAAEIALNLLGVDDLADYTEFMDGQKEILLTQLNAWVLVMDQSDRLPSSPPLACHLVTA